MYLVFDLFDAMMFNVPNNLGSPISHLLAFFKTSKSLKISQDIFYMESHFHQRIKLIR